MALFFQRFLNNEWHFRNLLYQENEPQMIDLQNLKSPNQPNRLQELMLFGNKFLRCQPDSSGHNNVPDWCLSKSGAVGWDFSSNGSKPYKNKSKPNRACRWSNKNFRYCFRFAKEDRNFSFFDSVSAIFQNNKALCSGCSSAHK